MASIISELRTFLLADSSIANDVGGNRIRPKRLKQNEILPAIRLNVVSGDEESHLNGISQKSQATVQVDCYADTSEAADALAEKVRLRLQSYRGLLDTMYCSTIAISGGLQQTPEPPNDGSDAWRDISTRDYRIHYQQATS